jgi:ketosteroid isomerase-like protein
MTEAATIQALQARLEELEKQNREAADREAIWRLMMVMQSAIDGRDIRTYAENFTEDGVWAGVVGRGVGPKGVEEILSKYMKPWESHSTRTWHTTLDVVIDIDGDTASSTSKFQHITHTDTNELKVWHLGAYDDRLVRTPQGWKYTQRNAYVIVPYMEPKFQLDGGED